MNGLTLAIKLARRELRAGVKGFRIFIACLALGVGAIAGVGSLSASIVAGLRADARTLLGGDVDLRLVSRPPPPAEAASLAANARTLSTVVEMRAMARPEHGTKRALVEMKAVDGTYPLVGTVGLVPAQPLAAALAQRNGAWGAAVDANLLSRLDLKLGDRVRIGDAVFEIRATVAHEPDRVATVFSLGPRFLVAAPALDATGLVRPGSRIHYHTRVLLAPAIDGEAWIETVKKTFPKAGWRIRGLDAAAPGVQRFIERMTLFLTFVGLTALLVGGIGVGNAVKSYLDGKTATIATMKCLGAPSALVFRVYLVQVAALALVGIAFGLVVGAALPLAGLKVAAAWLPVRPVAAIYPLPLALGAAFGLLTALTFALWPLARARDVSAAGLFRDLVAPARARPRRSDGLLVVLGVLALAGLTIATASDRYFAYWFVGGALVTVAALRAGAAGLIAGAGRLKGGRSATGRLGVANIHRPGNATPSVVLSLGLGLSVLVAISLIEGNLSHQIDERLPDEAPAFFFIDIQPDQARPFDGVVSAVEGARGLRRVPSLRGRIVKIAGVAVEDADIAPGSTWAVRGDRALTYAAEIPTDTRITAGEWWPADYRGPPLISLDAGLARGFGVDLGDTLTLNVLGREFTAAIASLREIDWRSLRFDFAIIFAPGTLEGAPHSHIAAVNAAPAAEEAVERAVAQAFANVSAIRVREALEAAARILDGIGQGVRSTALISILAGALVLGGAVAAGPRRRIYDAVVFKVLGATRTTVLKAFVVEYAILGLATGAIAALVGMLTAWAVVTFLMNMAWTFLPGVVAATVAAAVVLTLAAGFAGTWRAMGQKSAPHLRNR
jgi:putative ABC transport system permease protein